MLNEAALQAISKAIENEVAGSVENFLLRGNVLADSDIARFDLTAKMAAGVASDVNAAAAKLTERQFVTYDPSYQTSSSQVLVESLAQVPELQVVDDLIREGDLPNDDGGSSVIAMAHLVGEDAHRIVAYRMKGPGIAARRPRGIPLVPRDGIYRPVANELLFYEPRFDAFTCGGFVYFLAASLIQTKLQAPEKARQLAAKTLKSATKNVRIDGYDELAEAVQTDSNLRAKMAYVARRIDAEPDYVNFLTTKKLVKFIADNPQHDIPIGTVKGKKALLFVSSPDHRHKIPRLLADDYLHSYLTDKHYEAGSKQASD